MAAESPGGSFDVAWSGGKDSTCMAHLACSMGLEVTLVSEKDDLDYPGEEAYVHRLAVEWGKPLVILRPEVSPQNWLDTKCALMHAGDDIHGRSSGLSKACFYGTMEHRNRESGAVSMGLRAAESGLRRRLRETRGRIYRRRDGLLVCHPIMDWRHLDVYAYALANGIELMPLYRCIGLQHQDEPWLVRKSWWLPGSNTGSGQYRWLKHYWPSLYRRALDWFPAASQFAT